MWCRQSVFFMYLTCLMSFRLYFYSFFIPGPPGILVELLYEVENIIKRAVIMTPVMEFNGFFNTTQNINIG